MSNEQYNPALETLSGASPQSFLQQNSLEDIINSIDHSVAVSRHASTGASVLRSVADFDNPKGRLVHGKYIVFTLADGKYAVPVNQVMEVGEPQRVTPVPNVPDWVLGVTNLRGDIISVVDCGAFLNLHDRITMEISSMCVVRNKRRDMATSLMVDRIEGMMNLSDELIALPEASVEDRVMTYLHGVYEYEGSLLNILNLEGLLTSMELN